MGERKRKKPPLVNIKVRYAYPELVLSGKAICSIKIDDGTLSRFNRTSEGREHQFTNSGDNVLFHSGYLCAAPLQQLMYDANTQTTRIPLRGIYGSLEVQRWLMGAKKLVEFAAKEIGMDKRFETTLSVREMS